MYSCSYQIVAYAVNNEGVFMGPTQGPYILQLCMGPSYFWGVWPLLTPLISHTESVKFCAIRYIFLKICGFEFFAELSWNAYSRLQNVGFLGSGPINVIVHRRDPKRPICTWKHVLWALIHSIRSIVRTVMLISTTRKWLSLFHTLFLPHSSPILNGLRLLNSSELLCQITSSGTRTLLM